MRRASWAVALAAAPAGHTLGFLNRRLAFVGAVSSDADEIVLRTSRGEERRRLTGPVVPRFPDRRVVIQPTAGYVVEVDLLRDGRQTARWVESPLLRCYYHLLIDVPIFDVTTRCIGLALPQGPGP
jgi:hypothetical protein